MAISCYHDSLTSPIRLVCSCANQIFKKVKENPLFCADLFRRYSQLPAKAKFGQTNCNHTIINSITPKH